MPLSAKDIMNADVVVARDEMSVHQLAILLETNQVSGVPVLGADDRLVGVVSTSDILLTDEAFGDDVVLDSDYHSQLTTEGAWDLDDFDAEKQGDVMVRDIMSSTVITASSSTPIAELAEIMYSRHVHRVVIVDDDRLAGIVSTLDILKVVKEGTVS